MVYIVIQAHIFIKSFNQRILEGSKGFLSFGFHNMDALCLKAGIHGMAPAGNVDLRLTAAAAEKPTPPRNLAWGFTFRHPLRSLWPGSKIRLEPSIAVDDAVLAEQKEEIRDELAKGNWISEVVDSRNFGKGEENEGELKDEIRVKLGENSCGENEECAVCDEDDDDENMEFDRATFSKLLRKVPIAESRLYAQLCYLGSLAYSIPQIKVQFQFNINIYCYEMK